MKKYILNPLKYLLIGALFLCASPDSRAQEQKSEFSVHAGGLFSSIDYSLQQGQIEKGSGGMIGVRYSYYLNANWSIGAGAEYQSYNAVARMKNLSGFYTTTDIEDESFEFRYSANAYREKQKLEYINIPVTVQYESKGLTRFYASAGAKIGFAVSGSYETTIKSLNTSGYYPQYDTELFGPEFMGFGTLGKVAAGKQDLETKMACSGTLEAGIKQKTGSSSSIYIGFFIDYGLNAIYDKKGEKQIIEYIREAPVVMKYNTILNSASASDTKLMAYGCKIRVAIF